MAQTKQPQPHEKAFRKIRAAKCAQLKRELERKAELKSVRS